MCCISDSVTGSCFRPISLSLNVFYGIDMLFYFGQGVLLRPFMLAEDVCNQPEFEHAASSQQFQNEHFTFLIPIYQLHNAMFRLLDTFIVISIKLIVLLEEYNNNIPSVIRQRGVWEGQNVRRPHHRGSMQSQFNIVFLCYLYVLSCFSSF